jgi:hypothetical protein
MPDSRVVVLQSSDVEKLQQDLADILRANDKQPASITQSQSAVPVIGSRIGWENIVTITVVYSQ